MLIPDTILLVCVCHALARAKIKNALGTSLSFCATISFWPLMVSIEVCSGILLRCAFEGLTQTHMRACSDAIVREINHHSGIR